MIYSVNKATCILNLYTLISSFKNTFIRFQMGVTSSDLGFDLVGGKDDPQFPNDASIFVTNIHPDSPAYTKLKYG